MVFSELELARMKLIKYKKLYHLRLLLVISGWKLETSTAYEGKKRLLGTVQLLGFSGFVPGLVNNEVISHTGNRSGKTGEKLH